MINPVFRPLRIFISPRIGEFQPPPKVLYADTGAYVVRLRRREVGIFDSEVQHLVHLEENIDDGRLAMPRRMLEGVFDGRNEEQGDDFEVLCRLVDVDVNRRLPAAQAHQVDVVAQELQLALQRHRFAVRIVKRVAQEVAQPRDILLCLVGIYLHEAGNIVERVEKEMRVELILQPRQFRLGRLPSFLLQPSLHLIPADKIAYADSNKDKYYFEKQSDEFTNPIIRRPVLPLGNIAYPQNAELLEQNQQDVDSRKPYFFSGKK